MTEKEELINSLDREIEDCDNLLKVTKGFTEAVSVIQERKREAEAKKLLLEKAPSDYIVEIAPRYFPSQLDDESHLSLMVKGLQRSVAPLFNFINSTSGTSSASITVMRDLNLDSTWEKPSDWVDVEKAFTSLADYKSKKSDLPKKLDKINLDLGKKFAVTLASIEKAKSEIAGVDVATNHMRDVLTQIWGGLITLARETNSKRHPNLEFKSPKDRGLVSGILGEDDSKKKKMVLLLDNMYDLHSHLSATELTKNPLSDNRKHMNELFEIWMLQIDDLVNILSLS
jgi:hypothetical protein